MAGHSKWANIQHRKKGQDAKRGKLFTQCTQCFINHFSFIEQYIIQFCIIMNYSFG